MSVGISVAIILYAPGVGKPGNDLLICEDRMNIDQAVSRACEEPTLLDALSWICVWESERMIQQSREHYGSGANGAGWDTCFRVCLKRVMESYN